MGPHAAATNASVAKVTEPGAADHGARVNGRCNESSFGTAHGRPWPTAALPLESETEGTLAPPPPVVSLRYRHDHLDSRSHAGLALDLLAATDLLGPFADTEEPEVLLGD